MNKTFDEFVLGKILEHLNELSSTGLTWCNNRVKIKGLFIPLCCSVDASAQALILNMKQYNGTFGCSF